MKLSTRRFQGPDFVLYVYNIQCRLDMYNHNMITRKMKLHGDSNIGHIVGNSLLVRIIQTFQFQDNY